jgi:hypothetical protein
MLLKDTESYLKKYFHDENEKLVAVLGQGYVTNLLQGSLSKTVLFLTNKRIYREGKAFGTNALSSTLESSSVNVSDIKATRFIQHNSPSVLWIGIIFTLLATILFAVASEARRPAGPGVAAFMSMVAGIVSLVLYSIYGKKKIFLIDYAGGSIGVNCKWYSEDELRSFQKEINKIKEQ